MLKSIAQVLDDAKMDVAKFSLAHIAIYVVSFFYYGSHPIIEIQTDPNLQPVRFYNVPGMTAISGIITLVLIPMMADFFEYKRTNPNYWGNVAANMCNSLGSMPVQWIVLPWMTKHMGPMGQSWDKIATDSVIYLMMADFWFYWTHRLFHQVPWLWQFHVLHHRLNPAKGVSAIAAASTSTIDFNITHLPMLWWPFLVRGFCAESMFFSLIFMQFWLTFIHSFSFWSIDSKIMMDPTNHRVHHGWGRKNNYNFAAFTTIYDRAFGTYRSEKEMHAAWKRGETEEVATETHKGAKKIQTEEDLKQKCDAAGEADMKMSTDKPGRKNAEIGREKKAA